MPELLVRSRRVVTPEGTRPASVHIEDGQIVALGPYSDAQGPRIHDYGDLVLLPGVVDSHVHVNEPGRTEWEGFATATRAAAAGGVTMIVDMPLNSIPPTTSVAALREKVAALAGQCRVDVGLWGGAVPGNAAALPSMFEDGALGFKCFLVDSGAPEFGHLDREGLQEALTAIRPTGAPLLVHAELAGPIDSARPSLSKDVRSYARYVASRPNAAEDEAIELVIRATEETGGRSHIVHLSSASAIPALRRAIENGVRISAETTPHYLYFGAEDVPDAAPQYKCAPPIRETANRERLWDAVRTGLLSAIVSDHSPCTPELKKLAEGDIEHAWGGIASLQFALPVVWTAARSRGVPLPQVSHLMSGGPAALAGIDGRKGRLAAGLDADLIVFDPDSSFTVTPSMIEHRHKITPYSGEALFGVVKATYLRGRKVWENGEHIGTAEGKWVNGRNAARVL